MNRRPPIAWVVIVLLASGCGAYDETSTQQIPAPICAPLTERLTTFNAMVEAGELAGIQSMMREQVHPDVLDRLLHALLALAGELPDGVLDGLGPLLDNGTLDALVAPVGEVLQLLTETDGAYDALGQVGRMMRQCTGAPLMAELLGALDDPEVRAHLEVLIGGDLDLVALLDGFGIDLTSLQGRDGFQQLIRNFLVSMSGPDFDIERYVGEGGLLPAVIDTSDPTIQALIGLARALVGPGGLRDSLVPVTDCLLVTDTEDAVVGMAFDLLRAGALDLIPTLDLDPYPGGAMGLVDDVLVPSMTLLVDDALVRESLVITLDTVMAPEVLAVAMPDLVSLVNRGALGELIALVTDLGKGGCQ